MADQGRGFKSFLPAVLVCALAGCALFGSALFGGKVLSPGGNDAFISPFEAERDPAFERPPNPGLQDVNRLYLPFQRFGREQVRDGHLPAWNPSVGAGRPLGAHQGGPLFVLNAPIHLLGLLEAQVWIALLKLLVAGGGMAALAGALGLRRGPAALAAVAFAFSTLLVAFLPAGQGGVWALAPWALLAADRLATGHRWGWAGVLALALGTTPFAGHPESALVAALLVAAFFLARLAMVDSDRGERTRSLLAATVASILAALVAGLVAVPLLELLGESFRSSRALTPGASPTNVVAGLLFPELGGRTDKALFPASATALDATSAFGGALYIGALPLLLTIAGFAARRPLGVQWLLAGLSVVGALCVVRGPVHSLLEVLPVTGQLNPYQLLFWPAVCLPLLGGFGLQALLDADARGRRRAAIVTGVAAGLPLLGWLAFEHIGPSYLGDALASVATLREEEASPQVASLAAALHWAVLVALGGVALVTLARGRRTLFVAFVVALTAAELVTMDRGYQPALEPAEAGPPVTAAMRAIPTGAPYDRMAALATALHPNLAVNYDLTDARVEDLPEIERYSRLFESLGGTVFRAFGVSFFSAPPSAEERKLLDLLSVRWIVAGETAAPLPADLRETVGQPGDRLLENTTALPRAWVAYGARAADDLEGALEQMSGAATSAELMREPVIEGADDTVARRPPQPATLRSVEPDRVVIEVGASAGGWLVLTDVFYPGWEARIDGVPAAIHPANGAFRAVALDAGRHEVTFSYESSAVRAGWIATLVGAVLSLALAGSLLRRHDA